MPVTLRPSNAALLVLILFVATGCAGGRLTPETCEQAEAFLADARQLETVVSGTVTGLKAALELCTLSECERIRRDLAIAEIGLASVRATIVALEGLRSDLCDPSSRGILARASASGYASELERIERQDRKIRRRNGLGATP